MSILNDKQIKKYVLEKKMINPFEEKLVSNGISHGLSSMEDAVMNLRFLRM